jgi:dihydrofolate reductase
VPVTIVAAVGRNGVIGVDGGLPWHLPDDLRRFKEVTIGHVLVMGRKTYESIGRPLPGRTTVVVTRRPGWRPGVDGVLVAHSVADAVETARTVDDEVFVVGGAEVYAAALPLTDRLALTFVDAEPEGDTFFPAVDWDDWRETARHSGDGWAQVDYERVSSAPGPVPPGSVPPLSVPPGRVPPESVPGGD